MIKGAVGIIIRRVQELSLVYHQEMSELHVWSKNQCNSLCVPRRIFSIKAAVAHLWPSISLAAGT